MKRIFLYLLLAVFIMGGEAYADKILQSTALDRRNIEVTVYNNDIGLVSETRELNIPKGPVSMRFLGIPSSIIPESVNISSLNGEDTLSVYEQNYEYDLLSPKKLLDRYVGRKVRLESVNPKTGEKESVDATVLAGSNGPVFRIGNEITFNYPGRIIFPKLPRDLVTSPSLVWLVNNTSDEKQQISVSYLTKKISWNADYNVILDKDDTMADLSGWVTIDNRSGMTYRDAGLKVVAGDVHLEPESGMRRFMTAKGLNAPPEMKEKKFFEYYLYEIKNRTTIKNNQKKQIRFIDAHNVYVKKKYIVKGNTQYYYSRYRKGTTHGMADVYIDIMNKKNIGLGKPLPKGLVRVYKYDAPNNIIFIGEDRIGHTPAGEDLRVKTGEAFDIVSERKQTDWVRIAEGVFESSMEIGIINHKDKDVVVTVIEPVPGDWRVLHTTHDYRKTGANEIEFDVAVPAGEETKLSYRVRVIL